MVVQELQNEEARTVAQTLDPELLYLGHLSEDAIAIANYSLANELLDALIEVAREDAKIGDTGRFELLYEPRRLLARNLQVDQNRPIIDQLTDREIPLPLNCTNIMGSLKSDEERASKQFSWFGTVLAGDMESASQIASELWDKGSRRLSLAFMARQLGIPHPSEGR